MLSFRKKKTEEEITMFPVEVLMHVDALSIFALSAEPIFQSNDYYPLGKAAGIVKELFFRACPCPQGFLAQDCTGAKARQRRAT